MCRLFPILLIVIALGAGAGAGLYLGGDKACAAGAAAPAPEADAADGDDCGEVVKEKADKPTEYAALQRQFVIPVMRDGQVNAMVVASLALEVVEGGSETAFSAEPKLRDAFLRVFFTHAHSGGFDGEFTSQNAMVELRDRLREVAEPILGSVLKEVLITDIVRQDL